MDIKIRNTFGIDVIPENDEHRIKALKRYQILETPSEACFDDLAKLATKIFDVPISLISLVDKEEVYFKANIGMGNAKRTSRGVSLCSLAVLKPGITFFDDPLNEPCLLTNPNVIGDFGLRFYAGAPITTHDGFLIGTLCIIDKKKRDFSQKDKLILASLAQIAMNEIELRLSALTETAKLHEINHQAAALNEELRVSMEELSFSQKEIEALNEELGTTNEEVLNANQELSSINKALRITQNKLVLSNAMLADSEELKNIAIEQAKLGIWYIDSETREFIPSVQFKEYFGYSADEVMPYDAATSQIREDYRDYVVAEVKKSMNFGVPYDLEYPIIGFSDGRLRWVRATGKMNAAGRFRNAYFSGTILDITEQKENEQRKNDFISMVSHELKTPLTSMIGYIQMLQKKAISTDDSFGAGILQRAANQTKKMTNMINGFLDVNRVDNARIPLDLSIFDMTDLLIEAKLECISTITSHKIVFAPVEKNIVSADKGKIGQVITNLINNAVKYSPSGSTINVACVTDGTLACVSVKDQGIGIAEVDRERVFDRFYRVENSRTENIEGFGIGLYICQQIIKEHQGEIWVDSKPAEGSVFQFNIPVLQ